MEGAELVCDRSDALARCGSPDIAGAAIDLSRAASHDDAMLRHALDIGRARLRRRPHAQVATRGLQLLEDVISFLGVKPSDADAAASAPRPGSASGHGEDRRPC